jgi:hypothetical protein
LGHPVCLRLRGALSGWARAGFPAAGLLLIVPEFYTDLAGAALFALAIAARARRRRALGPAPLPAK